MTSPYIQSPPNTFGSSTDLSGASTARRDQEEQLNASKSGCGVGLPFYVNTNVPGASSAPQQMPEATRKRAVLPWIARHMKGWRLIVFHSWLNLGLPLIPVAWVLSEYKGFEMVLFILCIISLVPLVKLHDLVTLELAIRFGGSKTGLLNASMANLVEVVVALSALKKCELRIVQSSLIGAMLSKLLLVLGLCFFAGGLKFSEQGFDPTVNLISSSLLSISVGALILPAAYHFTISTLTGVSPEAMDEALQKQSILMMSHGVSIILLIVYISYLIFQLWSHTHLYKDRRIKSAKNKKTFKSLVLLRKEKDYPSRSPQLGRNQNISEVTLTNSPVASSDDLKLNTTAYHLPSPRHRNLPRFNPGPSDSSLMLVQPEPSTNSLAQAGVTPSQTIKLVQSPPVGAERIGSDERTCALHRQPSAASTIASSMSSSSMHDLLDSKEKEQDYLSLSEKEKEQEPPIPPSSEGSQLSFLSKEPRLSGFLTGVLLVFVTVAVSATADWLVESMDEISPFIRKEWVGLILLPAVTAIAECLTAISVSVKDHLTLSISVAVGSTIQTALFVIPLVVTIAWAINKPLSLLFDPFESLVLYIAVQTMSHTVADGKSNWLEGVILIGLYAIIAVSFWFYPGSDLTSSLAQCTVDA